mmetsp:Transcript_71966/g.119830  ORF Transcript_71966/g.119830 Transcript_71966/m.119830 type:complete len:955 (-) Transcript_71966:186-3050(-)
MSTILFLASANVIVFAMAPLPDRPQCHLSDQRVRWSWRHMINDYEDTSLSAFIDPATGSPVDKFDEMNFDWDEAARMGRSKRVFFSALKMARHSGDLVKVQWIHGIATNNVVNHFTSNFLPWHRKYHLEYENMLRYQKGLDDECPECHKYYSCITIPYWNWAQDQDLCENMNADEWHDGTIPDANKVGQPFIDDTGGTQRAAHREDGTRILPASSSGKGCRGYADASQFVHDFGREGSSHCSTSPYCMYRETVDAQGGPMCKKDDHTVSKEGAAAWGPLKCNDVAAFKTRGDKPLYTKGYSNNPYDARVGCLDKGPFAGWTFPTYGNELPNASFDDTQNCISRATDMSISSANGVFPGIDKLASMVLKAKSYAPVDWTQDGVGDYTNPNSGFRFMIEVNVHGIPHTFIGGNMISYESPGDPIFIGHHSMIDRTWAVWQDFHDLDVYPSDLSRGGQYPIDDPNNFLEVGNNYYGIKGALQDDWRGRLAYGSYVNISTGRYNRGADFGYGGKAIRGVAKVSKFTSNTVRTGPYTSFKQTGNPEQPGRLPLPVRHSMDTFDTPMIFAYPAGDKPSKCFLGPQLFTNDHKNPKHPENGEDNNDCYNCILKQTGPEGGPNNCRAKGFDGGTTVIEDFCLMWCGMKECEDKCRVSHTAGRTPDNVNTISPGYSKWAKPTTRDELPFWDMEHNNVGDYLDSNRMPGFDPATGKHYVTKVVYADDLFTQHLGKHKQGRELLDSVYHSSVTGADLMLDADHIKYGTIGRKLNGYYRYRAYLPVQDSVEADQLEQLFLGDGHLTLKVKAKKSETQMFYELDPDVTKVTGVGCTLNMIQDGTVDEDTGRVIKARATLTAEGVQVAFEALGSNCNGVRGNDWWYKYHAFQAYNFTKLGIDGVPAQYNGIDNEHIIVGTVVRIKNHRTAKAAGPTPWSPGTGFTETMAASGGVHIKGQTGAFYLTKV